MSSDAAKGNSYMQAQLEIYLTMDRCLDAIGFYTRAFGAEVAFQELSDDGAKVMHATLHMFGGAISLSDHFPEFVGDVEPLPRAGRPSVTMHVNLPSPADVQAVLERGRIAGGTITMPAEDTFWVMHYGRLRDPFGHVWSFGAPSIPFV